MAHSQGCKWSHRREAYGDLDYVFNVAGQMGRETSTVLVEAPVVQEHKLNKNQISSVKSVDWKKRLN